MATFNLYAGEDRLVQNTSGLGFFGNNGFGAPVVVGEYQGRTFVTNSIGTVEGIECNNNKYHDISGVVHGQAGSGIELTCLPNELSTINIRFTHNSAIYTQYGRLYIFDGSYDGLIPNKENPATGLIFYAAEIRHTDPIQTDNGLGDTEWSDLSVSGSNWIGLVNSPGEEGERVAGEVLSTRHDWYIALSCSPTQLGNKSFGMVCELEYL